MAQEEAENFLNLIRFLTIPSFHRRFLLSNLNAVRSCMKLSPQPAFSKGIHFALTEYISQGFLGHNKGQNSNVTRFSFTTRRYMETKNRWNSEVEEEWKQDSLHQVMQALSRADKALKPPVKDMFTDVYDKLPSRLQKQHQECMNHVAKYPHEYPTELYEN